MPEQWRQLGEKMHKGSSERREMDRSSGILLVVCAGIVPLILGLFLNWILFPLIVTGRPIFGLSLPKSEGLQYWWSGVWVFVTLVAVAIAVLGLIDANRRVSVKTVTNLALVVFGVVAVQTSWAGLLVGQSLSDVPGASYPTIAPDTFLFLAGAVAFVARAITGSAGTRDPQVSPG
jgi:hypothetical protein